MPHPPIREELLAPEFLEFLRPCLKNSMLTYEQAKLVVSPRMEAVRGPADTDEEAWRGEKNRAIYELAKTLESSKEIKILHGFEYGVVAPIYNGRWFDSKLARYTPAEELAYALKLELRLSRKDDCLLVHQGIADSCDRAHEDQGRAEFFALLLLKASVFLRFALSTDPRHRAVLDSWKHKSPPKNWDTYFHEYSGDATFELNGELVTLCCPNPPKFFRDLDLATKFFRQLHVRMEGRRYVVCSPCHFEKYRSERRKFPWQ